MTENDIKLLKSKIDNGAVKIFFTDGEEVIAKILSVSDSEKDIIYDVLSSNKVSEKSSNANLAHFEEIRSVVKA